MYPSLRGGNMNPGRIEGFYGEVNDVIAAADYLRTLPNVDPSRIYLGGHSTGGTLALLCAALDSRFRAVFAFGPIADFEGYGDMGDTEFPFDTKNRAEFEIRSPERWVNDIRCRTFIIEGANFGSNIGSLRDMQKKVTPTSPIIFVPVKDADHFSVLAPISRLIAQKVRVDTGAACNVTLGAQEITQAMAALK